MSDTIDAVEWLRKQRATKSRVAFDAWRVDRERWRMNLCTDGRVYLEVVGVGGVVAQIDLTAEENKDLDRDLSTMRYAQRRLLEDRRGANLWIARLHPEKAGWLVVRHADQEVPFRPVRVGARRTRTYGSGETYTPEMPTCEACSKVFVAGEQAFEADRDRHGYRPLGRVRICKSCARIPLGELVDLDGGT